jgi:predicted nucleic acid-binding protein
VQIVSSPVYLDASALAKIYLPERESEVLESALGGRRDLIVSDLAITEVASAMARRVREGNLPRRGAAEVYRAMLRDVVEGEFRHVELTAGTHREAERLVLATGGSAGLRAGDALHLAAAVLAGARTLVTFDRRMSVAARAMGTFDVPA